MHFVELQFMVSFKLHWSLFLSFQFTFASYNGLIEPMIGLFIVTQIAKFMGPTWGPPGSCRPQMGPMLAPWTLLSGVMNISSCIIRHSTRWQWMAQLHKSHNSPAPFPTIHHFGTEMCTFLFQYGVLWDMGEVHCYVCEIGLLGKNL